MQFIPTTDFTEVSDPNAYLHYLMVSRFNSDFYHEYNVKLDPKFRKQGLNELKRKFTIKEECNDNRNCSHHVFEDFLLKITYSENWTQYKILWDKRKAKLLPIFNCIKPYLKLYTKGKVHIISKSHSLYLEEFDLKTKKTNLNLNYNDNIVEMYESLKRGLLNDDSESLVILHSVPGTGKTSLIRHLVSEVDRKFVFIPNNLMEMFIDPGFMSFAIEDLKNCILIVEDAENILKSRKNSNNPYVSTILNLTDGFMKDLLNLKIICTINSDINVLDEALLRKGRLLLKSELMPLTIEKTNKLFEYLGVNYKSTEPMKLCDIYNFDKAGILDNNKKIGF